MKTYRQFCEECGCEKKERKGKKKATVEVMPTVKDGAKGMVTKESIVFGGNYPGPLYAPHPDIQRENYDKGEYDYEGDMTKTQLRGVIRNAQELHDILKPDENLPEWVQSKITLAADYIMSSADYVKSRKG
jgi:hypothetical protein